MKKWISILLLLAFVTLACLSVEAPAVIDPAGSATAEPTLTNAGAAATVATTASLTSTPAPHVCARVIADTAENLRSIAAASGPVKTWLKSGDVVTVINQLDADWWLVTFGQHVGYARSSYLKIEDCSKGD
jgi:uncharacterized protein YgiM (DUF1202 family)